MRYQAWLSIAMLPLLILMVWQDAACQHRQQHHQKKHRAAISKMSKLQTGIWGGTHIGIEVTESGAQLNYDCAHGSIDQPIVLDKNGRFEVNGTHTKEQGGPLRPGNENSGQRARYTGAVTGQTMTFTVTLTDTKETIGTFTVAHGQRPRIVKCL